MNRFDSSKIQIKIFILAIIFAMIFSTFSFVEAGDLQKESNVKITVIKKWDGGISNVNRVNLKLSNTNWSDTAVISGEKGKDIWKDSINVPEMYANENLKIEEETPNGWERCDSNSVVWNGINKRELTNRIKSKGVNNKESIVETEEVVYSKSKSKEFPEKRGTITIVDKKIKKKLKEPNHKRTMFFTKNVSRNGDGITVEKIWDDRKTKHNPVKIALKNGSDIVETIVLSEDNNWKHTWPNYNNKSGKYSVEEIDLANKYKAEYTGGNNCQEVKLKYKKLPIMVESSEKFQAGEEFLITKGTGDDKKMLICNGSDDYDWDWVKYNENDEYAFWYYDKYGQLSNDECYLNGKDKLRIKNKSGRDYGYFLLDGNYLLSSKYFGDSDYKCLTKYDRFKSLRKVSDSDKQRIEIFKKLQPEGVVGKPNYFYIVNSVDYNKIEKIEDPTVTKKIDYLQNNIAETESYNYGKDDNGQIYGTKVNGNDDYRLKLSLDGSKKDVGVDVLFVVDTTHSMTSDMKVGEGHYLDRIEVADKLINGTLKEHYEDGMLSKILKLNPKNKVAVTTFVGGSNEYYDEWKHEYNHIVFNWTRKLPNYEDRKIDCNSYSGTNYMGALLRADEMINDEAIDDDGNLKAVVFVTDGEPNHYMKKNHGRWMYKSGSHNIDEKCKNAISQFHNLNENVSFDCIGIGNDSKFDLLAEMANIAGGKCYTSNTEEDFTKSLKNIISRYYPDHVEISDPLSQYVKIGTKPDLEIIRTYKDRKTGELKKEVVWTMDKGKEYTDKSGAIGHETDYNKYNGKQIIKSVTYTKDNSNNSTGGIDVKFNPDYEIGSNNTFELCYNIKTTDKAKTYYEENKGYPKNMKGDKDTDFDPGKIITSSDKAGFFSNKFNSNYDTFAKIKYRQNSEKQKELPYPKPVVQIGVEKLTIKKIWKGSKAPVDSIEVDILDKNQTVYKTVTLSSSNNWKKTVEVPAGEKFTAKEKLYDGKSHFNATYSTYKKGDSYKEEAWEMVKLKASDGNVLKDEGCYVIAIQNPKKVSQYDMLRKGSLLDFVEGEAGITHDRVLENPVASLAVEEWKAKKITTPNGSKKAFSLINQHDSEADWSLGVSSKQINSNVRITKGMKKDDQYAYGFKCEDAFETGTYYLYAIIGNDGNSKKYLYANKNDEGGYCVQSKPGNKTQVKIYEKKEVSQSCENDTIVITNKYVDEPVDNVRIGVKKIWHDSGSGFTRPASINVKILQNGKENIVMQDGKSQTITVELSEDNNWMWDAILPKYDKNKEPYTYSFEEIKENNDYTSSYKDYINTDINIGINEDESEIEFFDKYCGITNTAIYNLPLTGKLFGTWLFTILGSAFIFIAMMRIKKNNSNKIFR